MLSTVCKQAFSSQPCVERFLLQAGAQYYCSRSAKGCLQVMQSCLQVNWIVLELSTMVAPYISIASTNQMIALIKQQQCPNQSLPLPKLVHTSASYVNHQHYPNLQGDFSNTVTQLLPNFRTCFVDQIRHHSKSYLSTSNIFPETYLNSVITQSSTNPHNISRQVFLQLLPDQQAQAALRDPGLLLLLPFPIFARIVASCMS